jgi:Zn-dependent peptidase ImmA (M78 family)/DNA-binding XRE family transcriptional regulator
MEDFNPARLDLARRRREMTKGQLATALGLSPRSLLAYERGESKPGRQTLARMADVLNFPEAFFSGEPLEEPSVEASSFRAMSRLTAKQRDRCLASGALALALSDWIAERFRLPPPNVPTFEGLSPEDAAMAVRNEWQLGQRPVSNMIKLLESRGVRIFSLYEETVHLDAFSLWRGDVPYVFLNTMKSSEHSRMDAAHELGHLVLHSRGGVRGREAENQATQFASAFLMPKGDILAQAPRNATLSDLIAVKRRWNVSVAALTYRLHATNMLTKWRYDQLFIEISKRGYRTSEPNGSPPERSQVLDKVFQTLNEEGQTKATVARELNIAADELARSVFGLVLTPLEGAGKGSAKPSRDRTRLTIV